MQKTINAKAQRSNPASGRLRTAAKQKKFLILGAVGLLVVLAVIAALVVVPRLRGFTRGDAEALIGAALPAEAQQVQFATRAQPARVVWFRFSLPSDADLSTWVEALGLDASLREDFTPFPTQNYTEADTAWWTPYEAQQYSGLYAIHANKVYELLLDTTDATAVTAYLRVYTL